MPYFLMVLMGFGIFFAHLVVSLCIRTLKAFYILLVGLLVLVVLDTIAVLGVIVHI
jgi:hypothetical protein